MTVAFLACAGEASSHSVTRCALLRSINFDTSLRKAIWIHKESHVSQAPDRAGCRLWCGLHSAEVSMLKVADVDSERMLLGDCGSGHRHDDRGGGG